MMPHADHDELARCEFVRDLKGHLTRDLRPGNQLAYERLAAPRFRRANKRPPRDRHEVRKLMLAEPVYQTWAALQRTSQEMLWDAAVDPVERDLPVLIDRARVGRGRKKGTLTLDSRVVPPRYIAAADVHCMPGGYATERTEDDVAAGAIFDFGVHWYTGGKLGPYNDSMGQQLSVVVRQFYPKLKPRRILDIGCTVGTSTLPYCRAFPDAEVHAIDVSAPLLRYAHARAEALGAAIHFRQANAEATDYPDGHFDLIVSHIFLHEVSRKAVTRIMKECHRLLAPGGVCVHQDITLFAGMTPYEAFDADWDTYANNEPCWAQMRSLDPKAVMTGAGFSAKGIRVTAASRAKGGYIAASSGGGWVTIAAQK